MSANFTKAGRKRVLDHIFGRVAHPFPASVYMGLFRTDPTDNGFLTGELDQAGYARVEISDLLGDAILESGIISNTTLIRFGPALVDWPEIVAVGVIDVPTLGTGTMLAFGPPVTTRVVDQNGYFDIKVGQFVMRLR